MYLSAGTVLFVYISFLAFDLCKCARKRGRERDRKRQKERKPGRWIPIVMLNQDRQELLNGVF